MRHTKEPWDVLEQGFGVKNEGYPTVYATDEELRYIAKCADTFNIYEPTDNIANARRIVSCVNACLGMKDPETEIVKLKNDRAELLEAYKDLVNVCLDEFVHIPEHRLTAEEYYSEELEFIKRKEAEE